MSPELKEEILNEENESAQNETKANDLYAPRQVILPDEVNTRNPDTGTIEKKEVEYIHKTEKLSNKVWLEFNDVLNPRRRVEGSSLVYTDNMPEAVNYLYRHLVKEIPTGYAPYFRQELTTENFHALIPAKHKEKVLDRVFAFQILEAQEDEFFFDESGEIKFETDVPINGDAEIITVCFRPKVKKDEEAYKAATETKTGGAKRYRSTEIPQKNDYKKIGELFASLLTFSSHTDIPIWIQNGLTINYFTEYGEIEAKN